MQHAPSSLIYTKRLASAILFAMVCVWILLIFIAKLLPQHHDIIQIFILAAEAGMVGGLADWYAITVLFHDPFKWIWLPKFIKNHTAIIPRNKERIANSMGHFVQENFLAPNLVRKQIERKDPTLLLTTWLSNSHNADIVAHEMQRLAPRFLNIFRNADVEALLQHTTLSWLQDAQINRPVARTLEAMFQTDSHHDAIQLVLETIDNWLNNNPHSAKEVIQNVLNETGMIGVLSLGATAIGFDVPARTYSALTKSIGQIRERSDHPVRKIFSNSIASWTQALQINDSTESMKLNQMKNELCQSKTLVSFISHVVHNLNHSVMQDLESNDSTIIKNMRLFMVHFSQQLKHNAAARTALNQEIAIFAEYLAQRYANTAINYIHEQIIAWDTRFMIDKIEGEVGGDLHMIRINGVVVGSAIGFFLGTVRYFIG